MTVWVDRYLPPYGGSPVGGDSRSGAGMTNVKRGTQEIKNTLPLYNEQEIAPLERLISDVLPDTV